MKLIDLTGKRFGRLLVLSKAETRKGQTFWNCKCDCGNIVAVNEKLKVVDVYRKKYKAITLQRTAFLMINFIKYSKECTNGVITKTVNLIKITVVAG